MMLRRVPLSSTAALLRKLTNHTPGATFVQKGPAFRNFGSQGAYTHAPVPFAQAQLLPKQKSNPDQFSVVDTRLGTYVKGNDKALLKYYAERHGFNVVEQGAIFIPKDPSRAYDAGALADMLHEDREFEAARTLKAIVEKFNPSATEQEQEVIVDKSTRKMGRR